MANIDRTVPAPQAAASLTPSQLLLQAVLRTAAELELNRTALARVLGKHRSMLIRAKSMPWVRRSERWI